MKDFNLKIYFIIVLLSLSSLNIKCQIVDFTVFPEDAETVGTESIFKDMPTDENILAAVQFGAGTSSDFSRDARNNITYKRVNNVNNISYKNILYFYKLILVYSTEIS